MSIKICRGPFTLPRTQIIDKQNKSLIIAKGASLDDKFLYLARTKHKLVDCRNLPELQQNIFEFTSKHFQIEGKSVVYAGFWQGDKYNTFTIPEGSPPFPHNASLYASRNKSPEFPIQPELIQEAIKTKNLALGSTEKEEFLAMPLVSRDRSAVFGILLLSNRLSNGLDKFNENDIEVARAIGEIASETMASLLPPLLTH